MDIKRLEQYRKIKREVADLKNRIARLQSREEKSYPSSTNASLAVFPYTAVKVPIVGIDKSGADKMIKKIRTRLEERELRLAAELDAIESFIDSIDDSEMRHIIQHRHIDGDGWQKIAFEIGRQDESYPRRKHRDFFKKF